MEKLTIQSDGKSAMRFMIKSKIHRATVTATDKDYEGSLTVDASLLEAADILAYEQVHVWDITRGTRLLTYAIPGEPGSGVVCVNGAGAHLVHAGDLVIIATFAEMEEKAARSHRPKIVLVNEKNRVRRSEGRRGRMD
jgi:aspartate 1-decarboxylase